MNVMRTTVATVVARDLIDERFLCLCSSKPDWRRRNFPCAGVCQMG
ncbi:Uncharacterised protein [Klebsiella pneumoniae]|uniref:Uncharacterized protein n=1 Tax=Klebsiella pneumoniae TaxID=573 RepID=A0A2X3D440_KLEPN|nr:Uncharacterised protein [Klebsiella pneumoniae]